VIAQSSDKTTTIEKGAPSPQGTPKRYTFGPFPAYVLVLYYEAAATKSPTDGYINFYDFFLDSGPEIMDEGLIDEDLYWEIETHPDHGGAEPGIPGHD
jgi:hypothetical protein